MPSISLIIPTKNEEKFLPRLLASIKSQTLQPLEIIVADNHSSDKTPEIAKNAGAFLIEGGFAYAGRNNGAEIARGDIFVFMDADTYLPENTTLETVLNLFESQHLDAAALMLKLDDESQKNIIAKIVYYIFWNTTLRLTNIQKVFIVGYGYFIICRKNAFIKVHGFSPMRYGEDCDFAKKISRTKLKSKTLPLRIIVSGRRYRDLKGLIRLTGTILFYLLGIFGLSRNPRLNELVYKIYNWPAKA